MQGDVRAVSVGSTTSRLREIVPVSSLQQSAEDPHASGSVSSAELVSRALTLVPVLRTNAEWTERERRIAPENLERLRGSGLLRLTTPSERGGFGASIRTQVEVGLALGRGCPSTAWVAGIFNGVRPMTLLLSDAAREEFYREGPDVTVCSVASVHGEAVRTEGGVRFSGTWAAASGCEDARWALLGIPCRTPRAVRSPRRPCWFRWRTWK